MDALHIGKLTEECKFTVTPAFHDLMVDRAAKARCFPSDLYRDAVYLVVTGKTHTAHVADDRLFALSAEGREQAEKGSNDAQA